MSNSETAPPAKLNRVVSAPEKSSDAALPPRSNLTRSGSASSLPGFYQNLSGNKRKSRHTDADKQPAPAAAENVNSIAALATASAFKSVEKDSLITASVPSKPGALKGKGKGKGHVKPDVEEDAATAALLGLSRAASNMGGILPTSPPKLGKGRITNQHVTGMSVSQLLSGSLLGQLQVVADPQNSPANKSPGLKRARSNNRRRSQSKAGEWASHTVVWQSSVTFQLLHWKD